MTSAITYKGNCHCGANRFEFVVPEITSAIECNCSVCFQNQFLWAFSTSGEDLKVTRGDKATYFTYKSAAVECDVSTKKQLQVDRTILKK